MSEILWSQNPSSPTSGPHRDYEMNLRVARDFCTKVAPLLPAGMMAKIASSQGNVVVDNLFVLSLSPPKDFPMGNFAVPVSLHQSRQEVQSQITKAYEYLLEKAGRVSQKQAERVKPEIKGSP